jgi:hypothetical protein
VAKKHQLYLDFPENVNPGILRIEDSSIYDSSIPVNCPTLEITPPGYTSPTVLTQMPQQFRFFLNACNLGIVTTGCDSFAPTVPDGIYNIRYSVSPNDKVYVEYKLLRIVGIMSKWYKVLCWINNTPCNPQNDQLILLRELQLIHNQILTAKHLTEDLHDFEASMEMLQFAQKKLSELARGCHTCH